jgi:hypothetical protein
MSFWFRRKDKQGRVHYYSVNVSVMVVIAVVGILIALPLPVLQRLLQLLP